MGPYSKLNKEAGDFAEYNNKQAVPYTIKLYHYRDRIDLDKKGIYI